MGFEESEPIAARYRVPIVVTGFEPVDIPEGVYLCVRQLEAGRAEIEKPVQPLGQAGGQSAARLGSRVNDDFALTKGR